MNTGVNTGTIIITKKARDKIKMQKKNAKERGKRANICLYCNFNNEGFCIKHSSWCGRVNYICIGIKNPYEYKIPKNKPKRKK